MTYWDRSLIPVREGVGTVIGLVFTLTDVTDRVRAEEEFRALSARHAAKPLFDRDENTTHLHSWQRRRDGEIRLLSWWSGILRDERGNVTGALSSARDITEHEQG